VGGVIGNKIIGGKEGAIIGAAIGGLIGNRIGDQLDEQDRKKLVEIEANAVRTNKNGSFVSKKGAQVSVQAGVPTFEGRKPFIFAAGVTPQQVVLSEARSMDAYVDTPLFSSPNENQTARIVIKRGVPITVVASVAGQPGWFVVGDGNVGIGYLPARFLQAEIVRTQAEASKRTQTPSRPAEPPVVVASQAPMPTDSQRQTPTTGAGKSSGQDSTTAQSTTGKSTSGNKQATPAKQSAVVTASKDEYRSEIERTKAAASKPTPGTPPVATVQASLECKVIKRTYTLPNSQENLTEEIKYCNEPPKGWQTVTA